MTLQQAEYISDSTLCGTLSANGSGIASVHTACHLIDESSLGVQTLAKCSTALHQTQLNRTNMDRVTWQSVRQHTHTSFHYSDQKMLPFECYVANKVAQYLTHIGVSSDKSHMGDTLCLYRQRASVLYPSNSKHNRGTAMIRVFALKCMSLLGMMTYWTCQYRYNSKHFEVSCVQYPSGWYIFCVLLVTRD
jgi:hypothetical protein